MEYHVGEIQLFAGNYIPLCWLSCNGHLLKITDYQVLYGIIGTTYGGDGINTFALPDLRGRIPLHNSPVYHLGSQGGEEMTGLTEGHLPAHTHAACVSTFNQQDNTGPGNGFWAANNGLFNYGLAPGNKKMNAKSIEPIGIGQFHENRVPFTALNYIICAEYFV